MSRRAGDGPGDTDAEVDSSTIESTATDSISVLDGLGFPTLVTDTDGQIRRLNDEARDLFAVTENEATGRTPEALLDDGSSVSPVAEQAVSSGAEIQDREEEFVVGGQTVPVSRTVTPVFEDGECVGAVEIDREIQNRIERRERTQALEEYQVGLLDDLSENLSSSRTATSPSTRQSNHPRPTTRSCRPSTRSSRR
ncbi:PAS domain-containing protein [Halomicroarcula sp. GCM10025710]